MARRGPCRGARLVDVVREQREVPRRGGTVLLVAHDQREVPRRAAGALLVVDDQCKVQARGVGRRAGAAGAAAAAPRRAGEPLLERAVPVVLDGEIRPPGELGGDDGPAVRSNANRSRSVNQ